MSSARYAFATAYLKSQEAKTIASEHLDKIFRTSSLGEAIDVIQDTSIGSYLKEQSISNFEDVDALLWAHLQIQVEHLKGLQFLPEELLEILNKYIAKYDISNTKAAIQGTTTQKKMVLIPVGLIHSRGMLDRLSDAEDIHGIAEILDTCGLSIYANILRQEGELADGGSKSKILLETKLDDAYYKEMITAAKGLSEGPLLIKVLGSIVDLINLQITLRSVARGTGSESTGYTTISGGYVLSADALRELLTVKLHDIPGKLDNTFYHEVGREVLANYEKTQSLTVIDEVIGRHKFRLAKELLSPRVMSPLIMAWYLILKETELRNLRLIAKSLLDNLPLEGVRDFLVVPS